MLFGGGSKHLAHHYFLQSASKNILEINPLHVCLSFSNLIALNFTNLVSFLYSGKENAFNLNGQSNHQD